MINRRRAVGRTPDTNDAVLARQATALHALAREDIMAMARSQAAERKRVAGSLSSIDGESWEGLADRLNEKLLELGFHLPNRDLALLGDLNILDYRLRAAATLIEGLSEVLATPKQWTALCDLVARLWAQMQGIRQTAKSVDAPLQRLIAAACGVRQPANHLRRSAREYHRRSKATQGLRQSRNVWIGILQVSPWTKVSSRKPGASVSAMAQGATRRSAMERLEKTLRRRGYRLVGAEEFELLSRRIKRCGVGRYLFDAALRINDTGGCWFGSFHPVRATQGIA